MAKPSYILALDQGTTSSRALVFDADGVVRGLGRSEHRTSYPHDGWVEQVALDLWRRQLQSAHDAIADAKMTPADIAAIGVTNQRETVVLWDRTTGEPVGPAIVWQDRRTADVCQRLRRDGHEPLVRRRTGLVIDSYFSATKIAWLLEHTDGLRRRAERGEIAFGTIDSWLIYNLTGRHVTDASNAGRTLLFDIHANAWDDNLLALFGVPRAMLPDVVPSSGVVAETFATHFGRPIPVAGIGGDQQAALFGQVCFDAGAAKCTYGTGCFLLAHTGKSAIDSRHRLLTTPTCDDGYALEGSVFVGGAVVQWLRDGLGLIKKASDIEPLAASVPDSGGVYVVPAFTGLGAPHWDPHARGTICGITRGTTAGHIARAAVESIAFQVADVVDAMRADVALSVLRVDGGAAANDALMQFQADVLGIPVERPANLETTAAGAAYLAGLALGVWRSKDELRSNVSVDRVFEPAASTGNMTRHRARWAEAVRRAMNWDNVGEAVRFD